jgi:hypothetical protein
MPPPAHHGGLKRRHADRVIDAMPRTFHPAEVFTRGFRCDPSRPARGLSLEREDHSSLFVADSAELERRIEENLGSLTGATAVWICYPKGNTTDIDRDTIWPRLIGAGWRVVSNVSIDATWSALRARPESA